MGLLDRFRPVLSIGAERGELMFRRGDAEVHQQPVVRVAPDGRIVGFGSTATHGSDGSIQLFTGANPRAEAALRAFCRHHVMLFSPRSVGLRPRVVLLESQLRQAFGDDAVTTLRMVLVRDRFVVKRAGNA